MAQTLLKKIEVIAQNARKASLSIAKVSTETKNQVLEEIANLLIRQKQLIQKANQKDLKQARQKKISVSMLDRLTLTEKRIEDMAHGLREVVMLPDPVGESIHEWQRPNGLHLSRVRIPLGVIAIVYESRPNVTIDAAALCLKSGNAVILRGGSEAIHSNIFLGKIIRQALKKFNIDPHAVQVVETPDRKAMTYLVHQSKWIDLIIPRGGESLMQWMAENSKIPVIKHDKGICHVFVDESANLDMAANIVMNSKTQRPGVCNALETLLVHEKAASTFLPLMVKKLQEARVEVRGDPQTKKICPQVQKASEKDWSTEYLDLILSIRVVPNIDKAIQHIQRYTSLHTESIVTENKEHAERFLNELDSSVVLWNASTRFNDGGQLGLGAEIGISTTKLHAFGPMGLEELTAAKFVVKGSGQIRE